MKRRSVVFKLFAVTSALILIVFTLAMLAEGLFFERFYRSSKIHVLEKNMHGFAEQLKGKSQDELQLSRLLGSFMNQNDASTAILDHQFSRVTVNPYYLQLQADGKSVTVLLPLEGVPIDFIPQPISVGDTLVADGMYMDEQDTVLHPVTLQPSTPQPAEGLVRVRGTVADLLLPQQRSFNPLYQDSLIDSALRDINPQDQLHPAQLQRQTGPLEQEWTDKWSGVRYAVLIQPLPAPDQQNQDGEHYLFSMTSLQPVGEAVGTLQHYFAYAAPAIVILVLVLSLVYSRIVSKPLVALNRLSARLAKLDFSQQPEIASRDEFGELSRNLISLSHNLDSTLRELKEANIRLQDDVQEKLRSEQLRKELIANISHELKTPLGIVKGFAEGLQDDVADDKRERYLALIVNETDRMNALILDMLELSKFEVKAVKLNPRVFPLIELVQTLAGSFAQQMEKKGLQLRLNTASNEELYVKADPRRIEQVVLNLLSNAVRHSYDNGIIAIDIHPSADGKVAVAVENTGPPIAKADMERIWDHFYRAERARDRKSGGTGLGLAIVKHILLLHGSNFGAVNTKQGVAFYFTLNKTEENDDEIQ